MVFCLQWPPDITTNVISDANTKGTITNSDLKLAGLVLLWLMMEHVCAPLSEKRIPLFSNNSPTVSWVQRMVCRSSLVVEQLIRVLALQFNLQNVCPITMLHIAGDQNVMTNILSGLFGPNVCGMAALTRALLGSALAAPYAIICVIMAC